jgi:membrane protein required for colicin V production
MQLNWVDVIILMITAVSCLFGLWRGLVREVLSLLVWIAAILIARVYSASLAPIVGGWIDSEAMRHVFAFAVLFIVILIAGAVLNHLVAKLIDISGLKITDRLLGALFGIARGVVIVMVFVFFGAEFFVTEIWWENSIFIPYAIDFIGYSRMFITGAVVAPQ